MHSKNNRVNHDFQIAYFLVGACHTADGAYSLLCDLRENREVALSQLEGNELRAQAGMIKLKKRLKSKDKVTRLEAEAELADQRNNEAFMKRNIEAAKKELEFINHCIEKINPHRKFAHLPDPEAHEASQYDEWKLEFISRAENYLLTSGSIPADQFTTMRQHPAFATEIFPAIQNIKMLMNQNEDIQLLQNGSVYKTDLPKLLDFKNNLPKDGSTEFQEYKG